MFEKLATHYVKCRGGCVEATALVNHFSFYKKKQNKDKIEKKLPHGQQTFIMMPDEGVRELFLDLVGPLGGAFPRRTCSLGSADIPL